jgi:hypothetical protein
MPSRGGPERRGTPGDDLFVFAMQASTHSSTYPQEKESSVPQTTPFYRAPHPILCSPPQLQRVLDFQSFFELLSRSQVWHTGRAAPFSPQILVDLLKQDMRE